MVAGLQDGGACVVMVWVPVWVHMPVWVHPWSFFSIMWNNVRSGGGLLEVLTCVGHGIIVGDHIWLVVGMLIGGGVLHPWWCCNGTGENKCGTRSGWSGGNGQFGLCSYGLEDFCELFECKKLCVAYGGKGWGRCWVA